MGEEEGKNKQITESRLEEALRSRVSYFYEHAESLNMLSVRRMLEEDLGIEKFALDVHKRFIKQFVEKNLAEPENSGKNSDSPAEVKAAAQDSDKDKPLKAPSSKAETGSREESSKETKVGAVNVQNTDISESSIKKAILERADYFRANSKTLQLVAARRLLEGDLGLQINALDPFKKFIRREVEEVVATSVASESSFDGSNDISGESRVSKEKSESRDKQKDRGQNSKGPGMKDEGQVEEDSPIMGLLAKKGDKVNAQGIETSESTIKQAILDQAHHFRSNAETLTLAGSRRFLEEKLGLPKNALDPFKKFIGKQIEEVLDSPDVDVKKPNKATEAKKPKQSKRPRSPETEIKSSKKARKDATKKSVKKVDSDEDSESSEPKSSQKTKKDATRKSTKKIDSDEDSESSEPPKSSKKSKKDATRKSTKKIDSDEDGESSEGGGSRTSAGKADKKNVTTTPAHSKQVEHLKSIIKACGMGVPPSIYKKAKQVSEGERESFLKKELEDILSKEGLSSNPSEKDIKEVKKRKERNKELEGIDLGNIVTSGRRRSVSSFAALSYPSREDDKPKVSATKKDKKITVNNTKDKDDVKNDDDKKKVEKASGDEDTDEDVIKQENEEAMEVEKEVKEGEGEEKEEAEEEGEEEDEEEDDEEEEEEEDSQESEGFNEDDSEDSD